jgi:flagellar biosynthesis protein FlhA
VDASGRLYCFTLHPQVEQTLVDHVRKTEVGPQIALDGKLQQKLLESVKRIAERMVGDGRQPLALCAPRVRLVFHQLASRAVPSLVSLAYGEVSPGTPVESVGMVTWNDEDQAV